MCKKSRSAASLTGGGYSGSGSSALIVTILIVTSFFIDNAVCGNVNKTDEEQDLEACYKASLGEAYFNHPDKYLKAKGIIERHGFPCHTHRVVSEDGYVLELHRIPHSPKSPPGDRAKHPVYIQHGIMASSVNWILPPMEKALAYQVADQGYDVWLGNVRGSSYSLDHHFLNLTSKDYWQFSWHEMGYYDVPAIIDYILEYTNQTKLTYIGHSMGSTMFFVCMSLRPEYNEKIEMMFALAPVAYVSNASSFFKFFAPFSYNLEAFYTFVGTGQLVPEPIRTLMTPFAGSACRMLPLINCNICSNIYFMLFNSDGAQMNYTMLPVITHHFPDRVSTRTVLHYGQNLVTGEFQQFDQRMALPNWIKNLFPSLKLRPKPKKYDLKKVTAPIVLFYADRDNLANPKDVSRLMKELPNLKAGVKVCHPYFNHNDFLFGINVNELVYNKLLKILDGDWNVDLTCELPYNLNTTKI